MSLRKIFFVLSILASCLSARAQTQNGVPNQSVTVPSGSGECIQGSVSNLTASGNPCAVGGQHIAGSAIFLNFLPSFVSGSTVIDQSGNGNAGTLCSGGNAPTQTTTGLTFSGVTQSCLNLPSAVNGLRTFEFVVFLPSTGTSTGSNVMIMGPAANVTGAPLFFLNGYQGSSTNFTTAPGMSLWPYGGPTKTSSLVVQSAGNHVITVTLGTNCSTDKDHIYFDGSEVTPYNTQGCTSGLMTSSNWSLGAGWFGSPMQDGATFTAYEFIGYTSELTASQVLQEAQASTADIIGRGAGNPGIPWSQLGPIWIAYGDSLTGCLEGTIPPDCWVNQPPAPVPTFGGVFNLGNPGKTADFLMFSNAGIAVQNCNTNGAPNIATVFDGTNSFLNFLPAANVAAYIANQVGILTQAGCKVFVGTMISRGTGFGTTNNGFSWNQNQIALDNIIRQNWKTWGAVGILDFAADPNLGCANCNANTTYYYTDTTHLINAGYLLMQAAAWNAMQYYFGYAKSNPNTFLASQVDGAIPGTLIGNGGAGNALILPTPLIAGTIGSISLQFQAAPSAVPITFALANCTFAVATSCTVVPSSSFTLTPAASTSLQTFTAGVGFTAPLAATTGEYLLVWANTSLPAVAVGTGYFTFTTATFPSAGAHTYILDGAHSIAITATINSNLTSYSMTAADGYIEYAGSTAVTLTLPSCVGQSGAEYTIQNDTSNVITLKNLNSTQPINGTDYSASGLALATTATAGKFSITDVPNILGATSGCHWSF